MSRCRESAGFLFDNPRSNVAEARCSKHAKPISSEHTREGEGEWDKVWDADFDES